MMMAVQPFHFPIMTLAQSMSKPRLLDISKPWPSTVCGPGPGRITFVLTRVHKTEGGPVSAPGAMVRLISNTKLRSSHLGWHGLPKNTEQQGCQIAREANGQIHHKKWPKKTKCLNYVKIIKNYINNNKKHATGR